MRSKLLSISDVQVRFDGRMVLDIDNFAVSAGECVGIIGSNGAGKTTLMNLCCGLVRPGRGKIELAGTDIGKLGAWARANRRKRIGYVPQISEYNSELPFTAREVVTMGRVANRGLLCRIGKRGSDIVDHWMDVFGLAGQRRQPFNSLSGGERQKVLIARAMAQEPEILMLDEPCSNLDFNWKYRITEVIDKLYNDTSLTVLMISHEANLLPRSCGRVVLMDNGRVAIDGEKDEVFASEQFVMAYGSTVRAVDMDGRKFMVNDGGAL